MVKLSNKALSRFVKKDKPGLEEFISNKHSLFFVQERGKLIANGSLKSMIKSWPSGKGDGLWIKGNDI